MRPRLPRQPTHRGTGFDTATSALNLERLLIGGFTNSVAVALGDVIGDSPGGG
jgi:hypothetical protein